MPRVRRKSTKSQQHAVHAIEQAQFTEVIVVASCQCAQDGEPRELMLWGAQPGSVYVANQKFPSPCPSYATDELGARCRW